MASLQSVFQKVIQKANHVVKQSPDKSDSIDVENRRELNHPHQQRGANPKPANEPQRLDAVTGLNQANSEHQPELVVLRNAARSRFYLAKLLRCTPLLLATFAVRCSGEAVGYLRGSP